MAEDPFVPGVSPYSPYDPKIGLYWSTGEWEGHCRLCGGRHTDERCTVNEHQRLADAAGKLAEAIYPDFCGDLPAALEALAEAMDAADRASKTEGMTVTPVLRTFLVDALLKVSRI